MPSLPFLGLKARRSPLLRVVKCCCSFHIPAASGSCRVPPLVRYPAATSRARLPAGRHYRLSSSATAHSTPLPYCQVLLPLFSSQRACWSPPCVVEPNCSFNDHLSRPTICWLPPPPIPRPSPSFSAHELAITPVVSIIEHRRRLSAPTATSRARLLAGHHCHFLSSLTARSMPPPPFFESDRSFHALTRSTTLLCAVEHRRFF